MVKSFLTKAACPGTFQARILIFDKREDQCSVIYAKKVSVMRRVCNKVLCKKCRVINVYTRIGNPSE